MTRVSEIVPRYEFRAFATNFGLPVEKMRRRSAAPQIEESQEVYFVARGDEVRGVKIRSGRLETKKLLRTRDGLEQWRPGVSFHLPAEAAQLREELPSMMGPPVRDVPGHEYSLAGLVDALFALPGVGVADVFKRRFRFDVDGCRVEHDEVIVNGAAIESVSVESEDPAVVRALVSTLRLEPYENVSYPRAVRRILGLERWPTGADDRR
jgi:hypothetical protein